MAKDKSKQNSIPDPGTVFNQEEDTLYTIHGEIRRGGMGSILLARDHEIERDVAMKLLLGDDKIERKRFLQEAKLTGSLEHPNIVPIHGMGHDRNTQSPFFTMKLVDGENLREILQQIKKNIYSADEWTWTKLLHIFVSICHAIEFAHSRKVIHRDLKPSNIMVGKFGEVQVMDWGVAKSLDKLKETDSSSSKRKVQPQSPEEGSGEWTVDGDVVGTIAYMPPEQAKGLVDKLDERSDVYSLGAILYEILCLRPPVVAKDTLERLEKVEENDIEWPHLQTPERHIPRDLSFICMKALAGEPRDRYQSASELRDDVERYLELLPVEAAGITHIDIAWKFIRRHTGITIVAGISSLLLMLVFFIMYVVTAGERAIAVEQQQLAELALEKFREEQIAKEKAEQAKLETDKRVARDAKREWQLFYEEDFRFNTDDWDIIGSPDMRYEIRQGELYVAGGRPQLVILKQPVVGDIRFEFDCRLEGSYLNDVSCVMSVFREKDPVAMGKNGYYFGYGSYDNKRVTLSKGEEILYSELREPLRAGRIYHVVAERIGKTLSLTVDDELIFRITDENMLSGSSRNCVGMFGFGSETFYDNVKIYRLAQSRKVDILELADFYMNQGKYETAQHLYENVSETAVEMKRLQYARSGMSKAMEYKRKQQFLERYRKQAERAFRGKPRVSLTDLGLELDASGLELVNLKSIQGMPFNYLDLSQTDVEDLTPLRSMPIEYLDINGTKVKDLTPLSHSPLTYLAAANTEITSIQPLRGKKLTYLDIRNTQVNKINFVKGMPLRYLYAQHSTVDDVAIFKPMPLVGFGISGKQIKSLSFLKGKKLRSLYVPNTSVSDIKLLAEMPLETVHLANTLVTDFKPIYKKDIRSLNLSGTAINDFNFLKDYELNWLDVSYTDFNHLYLIKDKRVKYLNISYSKVNDLSELSDLKAVLRLFMLGCRVKSLNALKKHGLVSIALTPHLMPSNWQSVLLAMPKLEFAYGSRDEIQRRDAQTVKMFLNKAKDGLYE